MRLPIASVLLAVGLGGCYASTGVGYSAGYVAPAPVYTQSTVTVETYEPDLVEVSPGVQVIVDYEEPVFYSDNYYWRYSGNVWYRSHIHSGGWTVYNDVPHRVRTIERPHTYARYRPQGYVPRARRTRDYRGHDEPRVRDHRTHQPQPYDRGPAVRDHRSHQPQPYDRHPAPHDQGPTVRDHRTHQPQPYDQGPTVRDHRTPQPQPYGRPAQQPYNQGPTVRDHRTPGPAPQPYQGPTVRDHRGGGGQPYRPAPTAQPPQRDRGGGYRPANPPAKRGDRDDRDERDERKTPAPYRKR